MQKATPAQIRKIYVLAREKAMDSDLLHIWVENLTGAYSIGKLSVMDAVKVIDELEGKKTRNANFMTKKQEKFIISMAVELGWKDEKGKADMNRLNGFCRKICSVDHFGWLNKKDASNVIEGLKKLLDKSKAG